MSDRRDSNPRHSAWEADTLPTELRPHFTFQKYLFILYIATTFLSLIDFHNLKLNKTQKKYLELTIITGITFIAFFFWDSLIIYPIKLFVVLLHEISHGLAAIISGGRVVSLNINLQLGGECLIENGNKFLIASAGYLGSLLWGSFLFISGYNYKISLWSTTIISVILLLFMANFITGSTGIVLSIIFIIVLFISPRYLPKFMNSYILKSLGLISAFYAFIDIKEDVVTLTERQSDAMIIAQITNTHPIIWGLLWLLISSVIIFFLFKYAFDKGYKS